MAINKVVYSGETLIDLTADTVTEDKLSEGVTAHDKSGNKVTGTLKIVKFYTGSTTPSNSIGNNGDLYLKLV